MTGRVMGRKTVASGPGNFITSIPRAGGGRHPVKVVEAGLSEARARQDDIHDRFINLPTENRIDKHWHWPTILVRSGMLEAFSNRACGFVQLLCPGNDGYAVPVGQLLLVDGFPFIGDRTSKSIFLWYLTAMPASGLRHFGVPDDLKLLRPLVDVAMQFSFLLGHHGQTCLHADRHGTPAQRRELVAKYSSIGLQRVKRGRLHLRVSALRVNDGRYFVADRLTALHCSSKLDPHRQDDMSKIQVTGLARRAGTLKVFSEDAQDRQVEQAFVTRLLKTSIRRVVLPPQRGASAGQPAPGGVVDFSRVEHVIDALDAGVMDSDLMAKAVKTIPCAPMRKFDEVEPMDVREWAVRKMLKTPS
jgi:hypothetical protein